MLDQPSDTPLLLRALRGEPVPRPPIWMMRQAGRYLPEYLAIRANTSFLELCHDGDLIAEVTLQPLRRFGFDAGIIFSDILLPLEAMGCRLEFGKGHGPRFPEPLRDRAAIRALGHLEPETQLPGLFNGLRQTIAAAGVPILGFVGSPFTLACYLIEGEGSKDWIRTKQLMWSDPIAFQELLDRLADAVGDHMQAQVNAGAAGVQIFDTWAGALSVEDWKRWALPSAARALARVKGAPTLYFTRDTAPFLPWLKETGASAFALDWRVDMAWARSLLGSAPVQGNMDPIALFAPPEEIRRRVHGIIQAAGPLGHVFNLGHGVTPSTPISGVQAMVDAVKAWRWT